MKELNKDELKRIAYNCRKATFLIEKKQCGAVTAQEETELKIHLTGCTICGIFEKQSDTINRFVKYNLSDPQHSNHVLNEHFKETLHNRIKQELREK